MAVFGMVLAEQAGLPVPSSPVLLFAGAIAASDPRYGLVALVVASVACMLSNLAWFAAGRLQGQRVLKLLCTVSLSPDSCVRQADNSFERRGVIALITAKFVPGLAVLAPPLAAAFGVPLGTFLLVNGLGALLYCATFIVLGALFHDQIDWLLQQLTIQGGRALVLVAAALALYVSYRWWDRQRFLRLLRTARIEVDELSRMMDGGEHPIVLDVRSRASRRLDGRRIPGARPVDLDSLDVSLADIPGDREIVVYCACPNEASAVKVALWLRGRGVRRVRPLAGGIDAWARAGRQVESVVEFAESALAAS
jgi:membrane protein DedA with SNARE-associated domain/rhodanese-related sulfurtransferase